MKIIRLLMMAIMVMLAGITSAQVTTSGLSGQVTDDKGETLPGATVVAVHIPSGTQYAGITNAMGRYIIQGMRPGGPYTVTIQFVGQDPATFDNVYLSLGEVYSQDAELSDKVKELDEIVVVGENKFDASKTGASQRVTAEDLDNLPSISHSIADATRLNPQISVSQGGAMSFAGTSNRYNSFQVDGAMNNDVFGLTSNGSNGGQAGTQPISMETIEQIQVSVAPFDVRQSGFTGGAINAVTKSGTNQFHGSIYGNWLNQGLIGSKYEMMNGKESEKYDDQTEYRYGATIGGPIVKNKLFFFANYEKSKKEYPNNYGLGAAASKVDAKQAQEIYDVLKGLGYTGNLGSTDNYTESDKAGVKLDWNINTKHKASVSWRLVDAKQLSGNSSASNLRASDYLYDFASKTNTLTAELQSRFTDHVSNEFQASYVRVRDSRSPHGAFPMIQISNVGSGTLEFGCERSSCANALDQDIFTITDNVTVFKGNHTLTFGTHEEFYKFANLFIQDNYGTYYFASPDNFLAFANGQATIQTGTDDNGDPVYANTLKQYRYGQANVDITGDPRWAAGFGAGQVGFYAQDKWNINNNFELTYGLRVDIPLFFDEPAENKDFNEYAEKQGWGISTNHKLSSTPLWSPRAGFRYKINGNKHYVLRGGVGVFTGRIPFVWLSNNFSNTGIQLITYNTSKAADLEKLSLITDPAGQMANAKQLAASGSQVINCFSDDFKFSQTLRFDLAYDFLLGGIDWTAEGIVSKTMNDVYYYNLAYDVDGNKTVASETGLSFDNRPYLAKTTNGTPFNNIYVLDNTNKGYTYSLSLSASKKFNFGLALSAGYTFTQSKSINYGGSSVAQSNYNYNYTYTNPNNPELSYTAYNFPHRVTASVSYAKEYAKHWKSTVSLIYTGMSGAPYSIYYNGDFNNDGATGNDLIYIPTKSELASMNFADDKKYTGEQQRANMDAWIENDSYLKEHRGEYYKRFADNEDFESHFDFHFAQQFKFKVGKETHAIEFSFDVLNASNMFSSKWGRYASASGSSTYYSPVTYTAKTNTFQFLHDADYNMRSYSDYYSRWRGQLGLKYIF